MVVRDSLFDGLLFGVLAIALALDVFFAPQLQGVATVLAVGLATYLAAQEMARALTRRKIWTQESLATAVALSSLGFLYYMVRNGADIVLVVLSLAFMMTSLMMLIAFVAAFGAALQSKSLAPIFGWAATFAGALILGLAAGVLVLVLTSDLPWILRLALLVVGFAVSKMREMTKKKPQTLGVSSATFSDTLSRDASSHGLSSTRNFNRNADDEERARVAQVQAGSWTLVPERGTLLDRFVPMLVLGALAFMFLSQRHNAAWPTAPAQAANSQAANASAVSSP